MKRWLKRAAPPAATSPTPDVEAVSESHRLEGLIAQADALRDANNPGGAARAYAEALLLAPWRTDLTVQQGNMFKDSGALPDAERLYERAIQEDPDNADIYLQLGHVMKLMGRRAKAIACYRRALALDATCSGAQLELLQAGVPIEQNQALSAQIQAHGIERMLSIGAELEDIRIRIARIGRTLPDLSTWTAIPRDHYTLFRRLYDVPSAPDGYRQPVHILANADNQPVGRLHALLESLRSQSNDRWTAVIYGADDTGRAAVKRIASADRRIEWMQRGTAETDTQVECRVCDAAAGLMLLLEDGATLHPRAVEWFGRAAALSEAPVFCSDLELVDVAERTSTPVRLIARAGFDPELLWQRNCWGNTLAIRASCWASLRDAVGIEATLSGRRSAVLLGAPSVAHLPFPLACADATDWIEPPLSDHLSAVMKAADHATPARPEVMFGSKGASGPGLHARWPEPEVDPSIAVIIPTRNNAVDCARMVQSLFARADKPDMLRCVILDNETNRLADRAILDGLAAKEHVRVFRRPGPFNWSALNNDGAGLCDQALLVFANDDMAVLSDGWDTALRRLLCRPEVGAVGAKLLYPDATIQHGGILFGWQKSMIHDGLHEPGDSVEHAARWQLRRRVSAVTGAFLAVTRTAFNAVGGFDAIAMPIGYSDVDLCLKLRARQLHIFWEPEIVVEHAESRSRGLDHLEREKQARNDAERLALIERWGQSCFMRDRTANPIWHDATLPFRLLRPVSVSDALAHLLDVG